MLQSHHPLVAAALMALVFWGCTRDEGPAGGTTAVPRPSGATEEVPSQATEAAPETEAAPR